MMKMVFLRNWHRRTPDINRKNITFCISVYQGYMNLAIAAFLVIDPCPRTSFPQYKAKLNGFTLLSKFGRRYANDFLQTIVHRVADGLI